MNVFWMGLAIFAVILITFMFVLGVTKGISFISTGNKRNAMPAHWIVRQVYSGDDSLGHPDLKKMSELKEHDLAEEGMENT